MGLILVVLQVGDTLSVSSRGDTLGNRGYSNFISSDVDFFIVRRFSTLNVRVALALQNEIAQLETDLDELDKKYEAQRSPAVHNGRFDGDEVDRERLLKEISEKLYKYNKFMLQQSAIQKYEPAPQRDVKSLLRWHQNHEAIDAREWEYLKCGMNPSSDGDDDGHRRQEGDLICIMQKEKAPLRGIIDSSLRLRTLGLWEEKKSNIQRHDADLVSYYSDKRMDSFASIVIVTVGGVMLLAPLWILQALSDFKIKLIVITVFNFVFLIVLSFVMASKPMEALGATAAYAAVLMVFLQLGSH